MRIGVIGDDLTGSSDIALAFTKAGASVIQYLGTPHGQPGPTAEVGVISLKIRSAPVEEAVLEALSAMEWFEAQGCEHILYKHCSTFDSTPGGNIGPVLDALRKRIGSGLPVPVSPAYPATGRTVFMGHIFVGDRLLSESGMENHPVTPMTDPDIRRWLGHQTHLGVGHVPLSQVRTSGLASFMEQQSQRGSSLVICDAVDEDDLLAIAKASATYPLIAGSAGLAAGLTLALGLGGRPQQQWRGCQGKAIVLSGSCSSMTATQIAAHTKAGRPTRRVSPLDLLLGHETAAQALEWAEGCDELPLICTTSSAEEVSPEESRLDQAEASSAVETYLASIASAAVGSGYNRIIVAGGETSGAVLKALNGTMLETGPEIDPGVPALRMSDLGLTLALKSGNFGSVDFFAKAAAILASDIP